MRGLDLLGLRIPVQAIGGSLLDGITSVTPRVRYLGFRTWILHRYVMAGRPDHKPTFADFALRIESALVLANLLSDATLSGLIGADEALLRLQAHPVEVPLGKLLKTPAATIYEGPSIQLGLTYSRGDGVNGLTPQRALPLARVIHDQMGSLPVLDRMLADASFNLTSVEMLQELGDVARIDRIPEAERTCLLAAIVPAAPRHEDLPRIATYAAMLTLAAGRREKLNEFDLLDASLSKARFGDARLDAAADGWASYYVRDMIAITQEWVLSRAVGVLLESDNRGRDGMPADTVIATLVSQTGEHAAELQALRLMSPSENFNDITYRALQDRIERHCQAGREARDGITRWDGEFSEAHIARRAPSAGAGVLTLALVAWIVAQVRLGQAVREKAPVAAGASYQGYRRMGMAEVILPALARYAQDNRPIAEVIGDVAFHAVSQHLQIAWSRFQYDPSRDVALMTSDGPMWQGRGRAYNGGRTLSRLPQALSWLQQLGLVDSTGLTSDGDEVRRACLATLATGVAA